MSPHDEHLWPEPRLIINCQTAHAPFPQLVRQRLVVVREKQIQGLSRGSTKMRIPWLSPPLSWLPRSQRYSPLDDGHAASASEPKQPQSIRHMSISVSVITLVVSSAAVVLVVAASAFYAGTRSAPHPVISELETKTPRTFHYNALYGEAPSDTSDAAWESLFPSNGGFFKHPTIAPDHTVTFAAFHQLHCLDTLRHAYHVTFSYATSSAKLDEQSLPIHESPVHVRHCIDLIRQALMCKPDPTIEVVNEERGGVTGFGTEHQCANWHSLVSWVGAWERWEYDETAMGGHERL